MAALRRDVRCGKQQVPGGVGGVEGPEVPAAPRGGGQDDLGDAVPPLINKFKKKTGIKQKKQI